MNQISIIIVSWNARKFLRDCLVSVQASAGALVHEVIVVDNASTDGSADMVTAEFPAVALIRSPENLGFARANNLGLARATGELLALINSDVIVHPGCLQRLSAFFETHPEVGLTAPKIIGGDGQLQRSCRRLPTLWNTACGMLALDKVLGRWPLFSGREMLHWKHDRQAEIEVLSGCFWLARRTAVQAVGGLDERFFFYAEDVDWCKRFWDSGWKVCFVPEATATHFGGASSNNAPLRYSVELLRSNLAYWKKHRGWPGQAAFYVLVLLNHGLRLVVRGIKQCLGKDPSGETAYKFKRSLVCCRWLLTGRGA